MTDPYEHTNAQISARACTLVDCPHPHTRTSQFLSLRVVTKWVLRRAVQRSLVLASLFIWKIESPVKSTVVSEESSLPIDVMEVPERLGVGGKWRAVDEVAE